MIKVRKELKVEQKNVVINMHKEHFSHSNTQRSDNCCNEGLE